VENIENLTVNDVLEHAYADPMAFIGTAVACGGTIRDRALALLKQSFALADERNKRETGRSIWLRVFDDLGRCYPDKYENERDARRCPWPVSFERLDKSGLWLPLDKRDGVLEGEDHARFNWWGENQFVNAAWYFQTDPRSFCDVWIEKYDSRLYLATKREAKDYFPRLGKLIAATVDPTEYGWRLLTGAGIVPPPSSPAATETAV
jgi:hypothetical protein